MNSIRNNLRLIISGFSESENRRYAGLFTSNDDTEFNYTIKFVNTLEDSISLFHDYHPDLYLIDIRNEYGFELCQYIRDEEGNRHTGIIFGHSRDQIVDIGHSEKLVECLEIGADDFIRIQSPSKEMLARTKAVLRLKVMTDELRSVNHKLEILSLSLIHI